MRRCFKKWWHDQRGEYLVQFVLLFPIAIVMLGLVIDGGFMYQQYRAAQTTVEAAAQVASHEIDVNHFRVTNQVVLDRSAATVIAQEFVNLNKSQYLVKTKITAERRRITVWGLAKIPTIFFRIFGVSELVVTVSGQGYPAFGINQEGE
ncbi:pilus assembly protein [Anaerolineae bacterium CFX7]|nr:pilus assembly protein [Anaerolineae bacterium CFX7]